MRPRGLRGRALAEWILGQSPEDDNGCRIWPFGAGRQYGEIQDSGRVRRTHQVVHEHLNPGDPVSTDKPYILHSCDVRRCVNPAHLRAGTPQENVLDAHRNGRITLKLTETQVQEIRAARSEGALLSELARKYDIDQSYVSLVVRGLRKGSCDA